MPRRAIHASISTLRMLPLLVRFVSMCPIERLVHPTGLSLALLGGGGGGSLEFNVFSARSSLAGVHLWLLMTIERIPPGDEWLPLV